MLDLLNAGKRKVSESIGEQVDSGEWRHANETLWREGVNRLSDEGNFRFVPAIVSNAANYVRARVKDAYSPRQWFPQSEQYLLNITYERRGWW